MMRQHNVYESDIPMHGWYPYDYIHRERIAAHEKHKDKTEGSMENKDAWDPDWIHVLVEEVGEISRVFNEKRHGNLSPTEFYEQLRKEVLQTAAVATAWFEAIGGKR